MTDGAYRIRGLVGALLLALVCPGPMTSRAANVGILPGTALIFSEPDDITRFTDVRHSLKAGGTRKLRGSSCCEYFVVAFPTSESFELQADGYTIATGTAQPGRGGIALTPDPHSREVLRWWAENEIEEHWNAGVFALDMVLRLTDISRADASIKVKTSGGAAPKGTLKLALRLGGQVKSIDQSRIVRNRFGPGPAQAAFNVRAMYRGTVSIEDLWPSEPYPPEVPCDDYLDGELFPRADYCYEP